MSASADLQTLYTSPTPTAPSPLSQSSTLAPTPAQPAQPTPTTATPSSNFLWPAYTSFPPFYTLQPNITTQTRQLELWTTLVTSYCSYPHQATGRIFRLSINSPPADLFANRTLSRSLKPQDIRTILTHMSTPAGGQTIEFLLPASRNEQSNAVYVWWKNASEWADLLYGWVDETGQKGAVLTVYELRDGEGVGGREWVGMDEGMLRKVLQVLVKRGKAQVFGEAGGGGEGVKFF